MFTIDTEPSPGGLTCDEAKGGLTEACELGEGSCPSAPSPAPEPEPDPEGDQRDLGCDLHRLAPSCTVPCLPSLRCPRDPFWARREMWDDAVAKPESDSTRARFTFGADTDLLRMRLGSPSSRLSLASSLRWLSCTPSSNARRPGYVLAPPRSLAPAHLTDHAARDRVARQRAGSRRLTTVALLRRPLRQGHRLSRIWTTWRSQSMIVLSAESSCVTLGSVTAVLL